MSTGDASALSACFLLESVGDGRQTHFWALKDFGRGFFLPEPVPGELRSVGGRGKPPLALLRSSGLRLPPPLFLRKKFIYKLDRALRSAAARLER